MLVYSLVSGMKGGHDMKRIAAFLAALALALSLAACGSTEPPGHSLPVSGMTDRLPRTVVHF